MHALLAKTQDLLQAFVRDESGVTAIEYALIAAGISMAIIVGFTQMGTSIKSMFNDIAAKVIAAIV